MPRTSKKRPAHGHTAAKAAQAESTPVPTAAASLSPPDSGGPSLRQLAHELNSLLDGSMRCVGLARSSLQQAAGKAPSVSIEDGLGKAHAAMKHMAALLERAMRQTTSESAAPSASMMFDSSQTLKQVTDELAGLLGPHAQSANATIRFDIADNCAALPAGSLGPVLMNGLRNALQACNARIQGSPGTINVSISRDGASLIIAIDGPTATKPAGHRIGLALSSQIVEEMDGELALVADSGVTTLRVCVPLSNLHRHA